MAIEVHYSQQGATGYDEDTWERTATIQSADELFRFMKNCYMSDAWNRSSYPLNGTLFGMFRFYERTYEICNLGHSHLISEQEIKCEWFDATWKRYHVWQDKFKKAVALRQARKYEAQKVKSEIATLRKLQAKYNS